MSNILDANILTINNFSGSRKTGSIWGLTRAPTPDAASGRRIYDSGGISKNPHAGVKSG